VGGRVRLLSPAAGTHIKRETETESEREMAVTENYCKRQLKKVDRWEVGQKAAVFRHWKRTARKEKENKRECLFHMVNLKGKEPILMF